VKYVGRYKGELSVHMLLIAVLWQPGVCQSNSSPERAFPQSKDSVEQMVKKLQPAMSGRLPVLDGFVSTGDQPLDHYRRAYYQTAVQVTSNSSKGSVVRVSTKITAWYTDPTGAHSGYRLLNSNGRLESDLLDQLSDELTAKTAPVPAASADATGEITHNSAEQTPPPPVHLPTSAAGTPFSAPLNPSLPARDAVSSAKNAPDRDLQEQIRSLEEVLRNQGHPNNLVAIKQAGTAVVASPSLTAKPLFLASAHDEFEMLDFNADWVHVRVSGLSRGWIWRNSVEMPEGIPDTATRAGAGAKAAAEQLFHVTREETAAFPGDWEPLKGKSVKILSIEKVSDAASDSGLIMRLEFAKSELEKNYSEVAQKSSTLGGIVLIFDSADGGMIAATLPAMQKWRAGILSDSAFWRQCFFDPPELGGAGDGSASR
jgi:hypothetical protein